MAVCESRISLTESREKCQYLARPARGRVQLIHGAPAGRAGPLAGGPVPTQVSTGPVRDQNVRLIYSRYLTSGRRRNGRHAALPPN
ncbi:hypothetical protein EVAR_271_1 [Eumeta japonica]|uniref:Uncharacterized protein n=1 Tax=Eumeta variegata TaxID=151549 RepID=A0A4C1SCJ8_EUMVA|nr:hypothetical protein EVAR_271_1 [Eumeta japonica]